MKGEHEESGSPRPPFASERESIQENHKKTFNRITLELLYLSIMRFCGGLVGWSYAGWVISYFFYPGELQSCYNFLVSREERRERRERDEQVISHSLRCLRCHHTHHALKAPLHVWTGSYPQPIRLAGQIFGDFNDMLPST